MNAKRILKIGLVGVIGIFILLVSPMPSEAGVLDDVPGAYAAYGLRRLSSVYNGAAIRVRYDSLIVARNFGS